MHLQNMCKKGARIFQKNTPKGGETWQLKWHLNDGEKNDDNDSRHITSILLWKDGGLHTFKLWWYGLHRWKDQSGSKKRQIWSSCFDKCQKKLGQMKRVRMREKPMLWLPFLYSQVSHQPNNVITQPIRNLLLATTQLSTKSIPKSTTKSVYRTSNDEHHL